MLEVLVLAVWSVPTGLMLLRLIGERPGRVASMLLAPSLGLWFHLVLHGLLVAAGAYSPASATGLSFTLVVLALLRMVQQRHDPRVKEPLLLVQRRPRLLAMAAAVSLLPLVEPWMSPYPHGVDWVGFSVLAMHLQERGAMVAVNGQSWWYPPGFIGMTSSLSWLTGQEVWSSARWTGNVVLTVVLLGLAGALHRQGAGPQALFATLLGVGLAAKVWDGGWPTVASLLVLPTALYLVLDSHRTLRVHVVLVAAAVATALVHPAGSVLLVMLLISDLMMPPHSVHHERRRRLLLLLLIMVPLGLGLRAVGPSSLEDGWQGGLAMLHWGAMLLPFAALASYRLRTVRDASFLTAWFVLIWGVSLLQLVPEPFLPEALRPLVEATYAMALYAFVVPAACLMALHWSPTTHVRIDGVPQRPYVVGGDPHLPPRLSSLLLLMVFLGATLATCLVAQLAQHNELLSVDGDDFDVAHALRATVGSAPVLVEQAPWGEALALAGLNTTTGPDVGVHEGQPGLHAQAIQAVLTDNATRLRELGVEWAITSPRGALGWVLERSPWWEVTYESGASRAWHLRSVAEANFVGVLAVDSTSCLEAEGCTLRSEPWFAQRWQDPHHLGTMRATVNGVAALSLVPLTPMTSPELLLVCLHVERLGSLETAMVDLDGTVLDVSGPPGHELVCVRTHLPLSVHVEVDVVGGPWVDPAAVSGRGDRLIEHGGLRFHAITLHVE